MENSERSENAVQTVPVKKKDGMGFFRFAIKILTPLVTLFFRPTVSGRENIPQDGGLFICANHISNWDVIVLACAVKRPLHYMAKKELFGVFFVKNLVKVLGAYPVNRESADLQSVRTTLQYIKAGETVGVFPQGHRYVGLPPRETTAKGGLGMLVQRTGAPVLPVAIVSKQRRVKLFRKIKVVVGEPILGDTFATLDKSSESYRLIADMVFDRICTLEESNHDDNAR